MIVMCTVLTGEFGCTILVEALIDNTKVQWLLRSSQKFSEVVCLLRPLLRSSQNIYKMAASKKPNLANYLFGAASRPPKKCFR